MGSGHSKVAWGPEERAILDEVIPMAFRTCCNDLSTDTLTTREKREIDLFLSRYLETYVRTRQNYGEYLLLSDYSDFLY